MPFTKEQTEKLNNFLDTTLIDWNGVDYHRLENWICDLLQAQTSSYSAAIEKMKTYCHKDNAKKGCVTCFARMEDNKVLDHVQNTLFTEGKV